MKAFPIRNEDDLERAIELVDDLLNADSGNDDAQLLEVMSVLIDTYENEHYPSPPADPVDIVTFKLRELGWTAGDLAEHCDLSVATIRSLLNRQLLVTWDHAAQLARGLGIRATALGYDIRTEDIGVPAIKLSRATR